MYLSPSSESDLQQADTELDKARQTSLKVTQKRRGAPFPLAYGFQARQAAVQIRAKPGLKYRRSFSKRRLSVIAARKAAFIRILLSRCNFSLEKQKANAAPQAEVEPKPCVHRRCRPKSTSGSFCNCQQTPRNH